MDIGRDRKVFAFGYLLMLISFGLAGCARKPFANIHVFRETEALGDPLEPSELRFSLGNYRYKVTGDGQGVGRIASSDSVIFKAPLDSGFYIRRMFYKEFDGDLTLIYEVNDNEMGAGKVVRLARNTLRMKWQQHIPAFSIGQGLVEGNMAYITAGGFVAKLDLSLGSFVWKHDDLYKDFHFNYFELPRIKSDTVFFKEIPQSEDISTKIIKAQKNTGEILSID